MDGDIDLVADGLPDVGIGPGHGPDLAAVQSIRVTSARSAKCRMDVALEGGEAFWHGLDALGEIVAGCLVQHVQSNAVRVHRDGIAIRPAQQVADG